MNHDTVDAGESPGRWHILRKLLIFQYKLLIDATKDILLSPLSLAAAMVDMIRSGPPEQMLFPELMRLGKRAERAINLFGVPPAEDEWTVDRLVDSVETGIRQRYFREDADPRVDGSGPPDSESGGDK